MYNAEGTDRLYEEVFKKTQPGRSSARKKERFRIAFTNMTPGMCPHEDEAESQLETFRALEKKTALDLYRVVSALCTLNIIRVYTRDGDGNLCEAMMAYAKVDADPATIPRKNLMMPVFTRIDEVSKAVKLDAVAMTTSLNAVTKFIDDKAEIIGIIVNPSSQCVYVPKIALKDCLSHMYGVFSCIRAYMARGIPADMLFPMLLAWMDKMDAECRKKDGTVISGWVADVIRDDFGDAAGLRIQTDGENPEKTQDVYIDDIAFIKSLHDDESLDTDSEPVKGEIKDIIDTITQHLQEEGITGFAPGSGNESGQDESTCPGGPDDTDMDVTGPDSTNPGDTNTDGTDTDGTWSDTGSGSKGGGIYGNEDIPDSPDDTDGNGQLN